MPAIAGAYEWTTHDHGISQTGRKVQHNGPVAHLPDRKKRKTRSISSHRTVRRKAHHLLGRKIDLRYPRAWSRRSICLFKERSRGQPNKLRSWDSSVIRAVKVVV